MALGVDFILMFLDEKQKHKQIVQNTFAQNQ